ncbi:hypothetical protein ACFC6L_35070 [Kitasatospora phosalacinea]|uniref:hypothetical protein n=1 Tax=Kitasatospora phosalacinea TaxID=2065 RepID=UPI0035D96353
MREELERDLADRDGITCTTLQVDHAAAELLTVGGAAAARGRNELTSRQVPCRLSVFARTGIPESDPPAPFRT